MPIKLSIIHLLLPVSLLIMQACQRDGDLETAPQVTEARIKVISTKANSRFAVTIDEVNISDSLAAGVETRRMVAVTSAAQRFRIRETNNNTVLLDTMIVLSKPSCSLQVLQYDTTGGRRPLLFTGGSEDIHEDSCRLALFLGDTAVASPIDVYVYRSNVVLNTLDTVPLHIYRNLRWNTTTEFTTLDMSSDSVRYNLLVRYSSNSQLVPGIRNNTGVTPDNASSGIIVNVCVRPGNGAVNVHNLLQLVKRGDFYRANCMIYF